MILTIKLNKLLDRSFYIFDSIFIFAVIAHAYCCCELLWPLRFSCQNNSIFPFLVLSFSLFIFDCMSTRFFWDVFPHLDCFVLTIRLFWFFATVASRAAYLTPVVRLELQARNYIRSLPTMKRKDFKQVFKGASPLGKTVSQFRCNREKSYSNVQYLASFVYLFVSWSDVEVVTRLTLFSHRFAGEDAGIGRWWANQRRGSPSSSVSGSVCRSIGRAHFACLRSILRRYGPTRRRMEGYTFSFITMGVIHGVDRGHVPPTFYS